MQREGYTKVREFTTEVMAVLDETIYPRVFDAITRIEEKARYKNNDSVAAEVDVHGRSVRLMEKFIHYKPEGQCLYFEAYHTNARGSVVPGAGLKSRADIVAYAIWDDDKHELDAVHFLSVRWLQHHAVKHYNQYLTGKPSCIRRCLGETLKCGAQYKVWSFEFVIDRLPEEAFVHVDGHRIDIVRGSR